MPRDARQQLFVFWQCTLDPVCALGCMWAIRSRGLPIHLTYATVRRSGPEDPGDEREKEAVGSSCQVDWFGFAMSPR
ncbi:hypothetical protein D5086_018099 [Populus alba]|uniref:Uncharacterized protein n=1 Tax=Populus alba TaxID=43335 RepID=A0ACC4BP22_POPAL